MKRLVHIAAIEHMSGMDLFAAASETELNAKIAGYCRSHWGTCSHHEIESADTMPDAKTIDIYFDDHENDSLTRDVDSLELEELAPC
jgi:hypothetical protein